MNRWQHYLMRPVRERDLDAVLRLSAGGGKTLTTLPEDPAFLSKRIRRSIHAFYPEVVEPGNEAYTFVLEDASKGALLGVSGVFARTGGFEPFYSYERICEDNVYEPLGIRQTIERLECRTWHKGPSELGSLYLEPAARGGGAGKLLSLGRLLFMASFPERFESEVIAEIRGWQDEDGRSPFWEGVIRPFFGAAFAKMDAVSGTGEKDFIGALLPRYPIYCNLLPPAVCEAIGRPHRQAEPAMNLLRSIGFELTGFVDVFDAGPMLRARTADLPTAAPVSVSAIRPIPDAECPPARAAGILFRRALDFRAVLVGAPPDAEGCIDVSTTQCELLGGAAPSELGFHAF